MGESIREVLTTLVEAIVLVILVIFIFLRTGAAPSFPRVTIPVSLVGHLRLRQAAGLLHQHPDAFGITLATGLVVDDAIVVIENIERHIQEGEWTRTRRRPSP